MGRGSNILLGISPIAGISCWQFSRSILLSLRTRNISVLKQARFGEGISSVEWLNDSSLVLTGSDALEWNAFTSSLMEPGTFLSDEADTLVWAGNNVDGSVSTCRAYDYLLRSIYCSLPEWWHPII